MNAYISNRKKNRPKFPEDREKFGTEFLDNIGDRINETAYGRFRQEGLQKQADLEKKVYESSSPLMQKVINAHTTPNRIEQKILKGISDATQIDERISTPLTYAAITGGVKGVSKIKPKHLGIKQTIEPYTPPKGLGKTPRNMVNITNQVDEVFNMKSTRVQDIIRVAKKNKISYKKAQQYIDLKEKGIVPTQSINPGTNAGLIVAGEGVNDPTVYIPPEERIGTQKGEPLQMAEVPVDPGDVPTLDLSTMIDPIRGKNRADKNILSILNANGMRGGRVDIFKYRDAGKNREAVEYYLSPYSKMVKFNLRKNNIALAMQERFGGKEKALGIASKGSFQAHHVTPIKAAFPGFHGIVKESPKYNYFMKLYNDNLLYPGNQIENIVQAIGHVDRELDAPHSRVHKMLDKLMGKAGEDFWTDQALESLVIRDKSGNIIGTRNDEMRERLMLEQIKLFKRGEDVLKIAMQEYELYASNTTIDPEIIVDYFIGKLPPDLKAQPELIKKLTREAIEGFAQTHVPSVVGGTLDLETLLYLRQLAERPPYWWRVFNVQEKMRMLPKITESIEGAADGYTYEQLEAYVDAGYMDAEILDKLINAPVKFDSIEEIIDEVLPDSDDLLDKLKGENPLL